MASNENQSSSQEVRDEKTERKSVEQTMSNSEPRRITSAPQSSITPPSQGNASNVKPVSSVKDRVTWTISFFDWNPKYFLQMRGIMNILHVVASLTTLSLLSSSCQLRPYAGGPSEGFFCKPPETFLLVVSIGAFFTSILYLFCCLLSKRTEAALFQTTFEIAYFVLYFILLLTASIAVMISIVNWSSDRVMYGNSYGATQSAAIVGLITSSFYGTSSILYFISHRYYDRHEAANQ